jgi:hypothetical protein
MNNRKKQCFGCSGVTVAITTPLKVIWPADGMAIKLQLSHTDCDAEEGSYSLTWE